ncbi:MAG: sulfite exporter TauE/SafE family protein [Bacteroidales bacterium]|nr:sulfite exporter TauE/SafE family protein [Bacteroidales bacterium]
MKILSTNKELEVKDLLKWYLVIIVIIFISSILVTFLFYHKVIKIFNIINSTFILYALIGFIAQFIDGMLGMAYGVTSTSFLIGIGLSPAVASSSVHFAEIFTTGISGISHWRFKNIDKKIFLQLTIPGIIGSAIGAYGLSSLNGNVIKPFITIYLFLIGIKILYSAFKKKNYENKNFRTYKILGVLGGFIDAIGGGGWGPIVTSTLITNNENPKKVIGSVNASEFFVTLTSSGIFALMIGLNNLYISIGLLIGGIIAAPLAAYMCNKMNNKVILILVGILIIVTCLITLIKLLL